MRVNARGNERIVYHKTNKEASTVFCSVVKHLEVLYKGSSWCTQDVGRNTRLRLVFLVPLYFFHAQAASCVLVQQNRAQSRLLYFIIKRR